MKMPKKWRIPVVVVILAILVPTAGPAILRGLGDLVYELNPLRKSYEDLQTRFDTVSNRNRDMVVEHQRLSDELSQAQTLNTTKERALDDALDRVDALLGSNSGLRAHVDSLRDREDVVGIDVGSGLVDIAGGGVGSFTDPWVTIQTEGDSILYHFTMRVGDVRIRSMDDSGNERTIYSVWVQSERDPKVRRYLGDYVVESVHAKEPLDWVDWWNPRAMLVTNGIGQLEGGIGLSIISALLGNDGYLLRAPVLSLTTNADDSHSLSVSIAYNVSTHLPFSENLLVSAGWRTALLSEPHGNLTIGILVAL